MEKLTCRHPQLIYEYKILSVLKAEGFPKVYKHGTEGDFSVMVMERLGKNLETLFNECHRTFSLKTVLLIAEQAVKRIEYLHGNNFIHRDIKPENFLIGYESKASIIYLIDFGLSKRYKDPFTGRHIPYLDGKSFTGTARYASINTHLGIEQSRRDDLESIGVMLIYFLKGSLPWQGLQANSKKEKYKLILNKKMAISIELLCKGLPTELATYMSYCRSMKFNERPDYSYIQHIFRDLYNKQSYTLDLGYDWCVVSKKDEIAKEIMRFKEAQNILNEKFDRIKQKKKKEIPKIEMMPSIPQSLEAVKSPIIL